LYIGLCSGAEARVFQDAGLEGNMKEVPVRGIRLFGAGLDRNALLLAVLNHFGAARKTGAEGGVAPRRDDAQLRSQGGGGQLKADLVVPFAGGAVGDGVGLFETGNFDHALGDERPGDAGAQKVLVFVDRARLDHGEYEIVGELFLEVVNVDFSRARLEGLLLQSLEFLLLADVGAKGDHFGGVGLLDPREQDRGIQSAGVCQNNFHGAD
jgi:hypothetical protein